MKLCMITPIPPPYGGIANWYLLISEYINKHNIQIELLTINVAPRNRTTEGRSLFSRIFVSGFEMFKKNKLLIKIATTKSPDLVHITTSGRLAVIRDIMLLKTSVKNKIPTIYHIRFGRIAEIAKRNTLEWKLMCVAFKLADCVVAIDKETEKTIKHTLPQVNVIYIPNPFDMTVVSSLLPTETKKEIVFVGWVLKSKGIEELLTAWANTCEKHFDYTLKIIGPANSAYLKYLSDTFTLKNVDFCGEQAHNETLASMNSGEIFILPSYTEGFPNAVLEAMALKKPIIATKVGAIPDMLSGECGILINPMSVADIENAINELINDLSLRNKLGNNAFEKLNRCYDINIVFSIYMETWKNTVHKCKTD